MKQKVSTLVDAALFRRVKLESVVQNRQINEILGEALELYLRERGSSISAPGVVAESWATLKAAPETVLHILEEEDGLLEA